MRAKDEEDVELSDFLFTGFQGIRAVEDNQRFTVPTPLTGEALEALLLRFCPVE